MTQNQAQGCILVVDDAPENIDLIRNVLGEEYRLLVALSGEKALELMRTLTPDLVLLDVVMPKMDGYEVCRRLKDSPRTAEIPVIFLTASNRAEDEERGLREGAVDYIAKPISPAIVRSRVRTHLQLYRQNRQLRQAYEELQRLEELRDGLVHMIVHDLRNPLVGIQGFLDLMKMAVKRKDWEKAAKYAERPAGPVQKITEMVDQLLDISKLESNAMPLTLADCDLRELAREVLKQHGWADARAEIEEGGGAALVRCDAGLVCRVIANLASNAVKFSPKGELVRVTVERTERGACVRVRDRGPGIPQEYLSRIFDRFFQVEARKQGRISSSGLGLTFCKLAVERHGGRIGVESREGEGSEFWFELPG